MRSQNAGLGLKGSQYGASSSDSYRDKLKKLVSLTRSVFLSFFIFLWDFFFLVSAICSFGFFFACSSLFSVITIFFFYFISSLPLFAHLRPSSPLFAPLRPSSPLFAPSLPLFARLRPSSPIFAPLLPSPSLFFSLSLAVCTALIPYLVVCRLVLCVIFFFHFVFYCFSLEQARSRFNES